MFGASLLIFVAITTILASLRVVTIILRIDSSARTADSVSRDLASRLIERFPDETTVRIRDLSHGVPTARRGDAPCDVDSG